jgi:hypothetical protein
MDRRVAESLRAWFRTHSSVITHGEALRLGLSRAQIRYLVGSGDWEVLQPRVYRDASAVRAPIQAVVAACAAAPGAVASDATAVWLWGMADRPPEKVHLTTRLARRPTLRGVILHRRDDLDSSRTVWRRGAPCTDPLRTLADVGSCLPRDQVVRAIDQSLAKGLVTVAGLEAEVDRVGRRGRRGPAILRAALIDRGFIGSPAPSVLESRALRLFRSAQLPIGHCEHVAGAQGEYRLDFAIEPWPGGAMIALEVHGYVWHHTPEHLQRDLARQRRLTLRGWTYLAYTWRDVTKEPDRVVSEILEAMARGPDRAVAQVRGHGERGGQGPSVGRETG